MNYMAIKEKNKLLNWQEIRAGATHVKSRPLFFWFDINGPCNIECKHCGFQVHGRTSDQEVSERVYREVMSELMPFAYVCNLGGTNWGEMTIAKSFARFIADCKRHQVKVNLTTNGTRMSDEWFDDLLDVLTVIGFSMEGMNEEFEKMRGFKWRFFLKHVEKVCQAKADHGKDFRVEFRFCAHADNIHQLPDLIRLANEIGVDRIQVMPLTPYLPEQKYKMLSYHRSHANHCFAEGRQAALETGVDIIVPPDFDCGTFDRELIQIGNGNGNSQQQTVDSLTMVSCYHPWQTCSINELGQVKPCCVYWKQMGDVSTSSFESVWNGQKYRSLRKNVNAPKPNQICFDCRMPKFDGENSSSASQLRPSLKETARSLALNILKPRPTSVMYKGVLAPEYAPLNDNAT